MADSTTNIQQIVAGENADARCNENFDAGSPAMAYGRRASATTGLTWGYYGARVFGANISNGTASLTGSTTNYLVASRATGAVSVSTVTTNWNDTNAYARLYSIVTGSSSITSYEDHRDMMSAASTIGAVTNDNNTNRDIDTTDANKYLRMTNSSAKTVTFRPNATHALPANSEYHIRNAGTGDLTLTPGSGVTLNAPSGGTLVISNKMTVTVKKVDTNEYDVIGQTVPL